MYNQVPNQPMNPQFPPGAAYNQPYMTQPPNPAFDPYGQQQQNAYVAPQSGPQPAPGFDPYAADGLGKGLAQDSRLGFIRKVYGILSAQLSMTAMAVCLAMIDQNASRDFFRGAPALMVLALIVYIVTLYALGCYRSVARSVPTNYILLGLFTASMSYFVASITSFYEPEIVLAAAVLTAAVVIALTFYAITTKTDFTFCGGVVWAFFFVVLTCTIMSFFLRGRVAQVWISGLIIFIMSFYIIYDTQVIVGNHELKLEIDDYVFAAMMLYIDIIRLFLEILKALGKK
jgi:FtsH-binding integral membrane protein